MFDNDLQDIYKITFKVKIPDELSPLILCWDARACILGTRYHEQLKSYNAETNIQDSLQTNILVVFVTLKSRSKINEIFKYI